LHGPVTRLVRLALEVNHCQQRNARPCSEIVAWPPQEGARGTALSGADCFHVDVAGAAGNPTADQRVAEDAAKLVPDRPEAMIMAAVPPSLRVSVAAGSVRPTGPDRHGTRIKVEINGYAWTDAIGALQFETCIRRGAPERCTSVAAR
jgi:hypothetical protein